MLIFVTVFATVVFCQQTPDENEVSDGLAKKKCADDIRVYHGKILVNTRLETSSKREWHTFDSFMIFLRGESSA